MAIILYSRAGDNTAPVATLSYIHGASNTGYPLTNLVDGFPSKPARSVGSTTTGASCTIRALFTTVNQPSLELVAFGPHNLTTGASVSLQNPNGLNQPITINPQTEDGLCLNPWIDLTGISSGTRTSTQWDLVITGVTSTNGVAIGEYVLIGTNGKRQLNLLYGLVQGEEHKTITSMTDHGVKLKYFLGVRQRNLNGQIVNDSDRANILSLMRDAQGQYKGFLLIPDNTVNDALFVDLNVDEREFTRTAPTYSPIKLQFLELQNGPALF